MNTSSGCHHIEKSSQGQVKLKCQSRFQIPKSRENLILVKMWKESEMRWRRRRRWRWDQDWQQKSFRWVRVKCLKKWQQYLDGWYYIYLYKWLIVHDLKKDGSNKGFLNPGTGAVRIYQVIQGIVRWDGFDSSNDIQGNKAFMLMLFNEIEEDERGKKKEERGKRKEQRAERREERGKRQEERRRYEGMKSWKWKWKWKERKVKMFI